MSQQGNQLSQRMKKTRQKIEELNKINPEAYMTQEQLQQKIKKFRKNDRNTLTSYYKKDEKIQNINIHKRQPSTPQQESKRIFWLDSSSYKNSHSIYSNTVNVQKKSSEALFLENSKEKLGPQEQQKQQVLNFTSNEPQTANTIQILHIQNQEILRLKEQKETIIEQLQPLQQNKDKIDMPSISNQQVQWQQNQNNLLKQKSSNGQKSANQLNKDEDKDQPSRQKTKIFHLGQNNAKINQQHSNVINPANFQNHMSLSQNPFQKTKQLQVNSLINLNQIEIIQERNYRSQSRYSLPTEHTGTTGIFVGTKNKYSNQNRSNAPQIADSQSSFQIDNKGNNQKGQNKVSFAESKQRNICNQSRTSQENINVTSSISLKDNEVGNLKNPNNNQAISIQSKKQQAVIAPNSGQSSLSINISSKGTELKPTLRVNFLSPPVKQQIKVSQPLFGFSQNGKGGIEISNQKQSDITNNQRDNLFQNQFVSISTNNLTPSQFSLNNSATNYAQNNLPISTNNLTPSQFSLNNSATNYVQNNLPNPQKKEAQLIFGNNPSTLNSSKQAIKEQKNIQNQETSINVQDTNEAKDKTNPVAIDTFPSGKITQPRNIFSDNNPISNLFNSNIPKKNIFQNLSGIPISNPANIFNNNSGGLFSQNTLTASPIPIPNFMTQTSNNLFGSNQNCNAPRQGLFGNRQGSIFSQEKKGQTNNEEGEGEEEEDGEGADGLEDVDEANPSLSTGKYDYIRTQIFFKENANKFRQGTNQTLENILVSIEKFENSDDKYLYVRMSNKCIVYCGKFLKNITEARILNNSQKNIEIKKILLSGEDTSKVELSIVKIQFKEEKVGKKFFQEVQKIIQKRNP